MPLHTGSETDYDLSQDTPFSSQRISQSHHPLEVCSTDLDTKYESVPRTVTNLYRSYMWDFNPQTENHVSWQDTIQEESFEDEEITSNSK